MATDNLSHLLTIMMVTGIWPKLEWSKRAKLFYRLYSRVIDGLMLFYVTTKVIMASKALFCDKIYEEIFEASYLVVIFLQRWSLSEERFSKIITMLYEMKTSAEIENEIAKRYNTWGRRISIAFAMSTIFGLYQLFFLQKPPTYCAAQDRDRFDLSRRLIIELWLPYDETRSPYWEITDSVLKFLVVITAAQLYLFSVLVLLIVLEACCHFKIVTSLLKNELIYNKERLEPGKVHLGSVIKYHQKILNFSRELSNCFLAVLAFKMVFLVIPMVVAVFSFSKQIGHRKLAMGHFMIQMFVELFIYCWFGEQLTAHSQLVSEAAYETRWLELDMSDRKSLMLMMRMSQRPIKLEYISGSRSATNLDTFIGICQFAYSLYTVMGVLSKRHNVAVNSTD